MRNVGIGLVVFSVALIVGCGTEVDNNKPHVVETVKGFIPMSFIKGGCQPRAGCTQDRVVFLSQSGLRHEDKLEKINFTLGDNEERYVESNVYSDGNGYAVVYLRKSDFDPGQPLGIKQVKNEQITEKLENEK